MEWDKNNFADFIVAATEDIVNRAIDEGRFNITERVELINIVLESMDAAQTIVLNDLKSSQIQ